MDFSRKAAVYTVLIFSLCPTIRTFAQYKAMAGVSIEAGAKLYPLKYYNQLATFQPSITIRLEERNEHALGLWLRLGILLDPSFYKLQSESTLASKVYISFIHRSLSFESLIIFPLQNEQFSLLVGIGMDYKLPVTTAYRITTSNSISTYQPGGEIDSIQQLANLYQRPLIPSASIGLQYQLPRITRLRIYCILRQNLLDSFEENIPAYSINTGKSGQEPTNYKPTFLRLGINYDFW